MYIPYFRVFVYIFYYNCPIIARMLDISKNACHKNKKLA